MGAMLVLPERLIADGGLHVRDGRTVSIAPALA